MKRHLFAIIAVLAVAVTARAQYGSAIYRDSGGNRMVVGTNGILLFNGGSLRFTPTDTVPTSPAEGWLYWDDSENMLKLYNGAGWVALATATSTGTLDEAYDSGGAGSGRTINATDGALLVQSTDADATNLLELNKSPSAGAAGAALAITLGANATGAGLTFANSGSGNDITGTSSSWSITKAGAATFSSFYQPAIASAGSGNVALTVDAAGNGTITIGGTSTGNTIFPGVVAFNGNTTLGNAVSDTVTITGSVAANLTLDDGVTDSPSLVFKDATDTTMTLSKVNNNYFGMTSSDAASGLKVLTGNLWVGNGTPGSIAMDGEDFYVNGDSEFDGSVQFDGLATFTGTAILSSASILGVPGTGYSMVFEGATANEFETTLAIADPTADNVATLPNGSGTLMLSSLATNAPDAANAVTGASNALLWEGTANDNELTLTAADPGADVTITLPSATGTVMLSSLATNAPDVVNSVTGASNGLLFEGTADEFETTLTAADATADQTVTLANASGTVMLSSLATNGPDVANSVTGASNGLVFEGTADEFEITLAAADAGADYTVTLPGRTGTVSLDTASVTAKTDNYPVTTASAGQVFTNTGDADGVVLTLPEASTAVGMKFTFVVLAAQNLDVDVDAADQILGLTNAAGDKIRCATAGSTVTLLAADATNWVVINSYGTWADAN